MHACTCTCSIVNSLRNAINCPDHYHIHVYYAIKSLASFMISNKGHVHSWWYLHFSYCILTNYTQLTVTNTSLNTVHTSLACIPEVWPTNPLPRLGLFPSSPMAGEQRGGEFMICVWCSNCD